MATNLTETATYDANVPVPDDNDPASHASLVAMMQPVADRTAYLRKLVELAGGAGVKRVQTVADVTALKAIATQNDGDFCEVGQLGLYKFVAGDSTTSDDVMVATPTSGTAGRWKHVLLGLMGAALGLGRLDANAYVDDSTRVWANVTTGVSPATNASNGITAAVPSESAISVTLAKARKSTNYVVNVTTIGNAVGPFFWWVSLNTTGFLIGAFEADGSTVDFSTTTIDLCFEVVGG